MSERNVDSSRRNFLRAAAGTATVTAASGTAVAQDGGRPDWPSYMDDADDNGYEDLRGESEVTISVQSNYYEPTFVWVDPETTIIWEFDASGHNVKFNSQPDGASVEGTAGGEFDVIDQGSTYEVALETGGIYTYFCGPHEGQGMKGAIAVGDDVETAEPSGGGGPAGPSLPDDAKMLGIASGFAMVSTLGLAYFFMKYGGDYDEVES